jgi:zinc protease
VGVGLSRDRDAVVRLRRTPLRGGAGLRYQLPATSYQLGVRARPARGNVPGMKRRSSVLALLLAACATTPRSAPPAASPAAGTPAAAPVADADRPMTLWPRLKKARLPNGLTYYILQHKKPEKRALLWLAVNAGSVQEDEDQRGVAHFVEHMAFNGTRRFPKSELISYLEAIGMGFGADVNAYTNFDETVYQLQVPTDDVQFIGRGLDVIRDWTADVTFDPDEVEKERGVILEEWRQGRGVAARLIDKQARVLFKGSRYAERLTIGQPEIIKGAPRNTIARFYKDWYRPELMAVIAVGDFDPAAVEKEIIARFGDLPKSPAGARQRPAAGMPDADGTRVIAFTDRELPGQMVSVYNLVPHRPEASLNDYRRIMVETVYQAILNERLGALARRPEAPFAGAGASVNTFTREIDAFIRAAQVKGGRVEDTLRSLFVEVLRVEKHGVTQEELDRARANLGRFYDQIAIEESTRDSSEYADEITRNFFEGELIIGRVAEKDHTLSILPTITLEELNSLARSFGAAHNRVISIAGPEGRPLPSEARVREIIAEVEKTEIDPWQGKAAATELMAQPPKPGKIVAERQIAPLGVTEWTLSNGARVVVKPTDFEKDNVLITSVSPGGLAIANGKQYAHARFADDVAGIGGVGDLDDETLDKVLAGKQLQVGTDIDDTTEGIQARGSSRDLEPMLQLLHLRMTAPRKDDQAIAVWKANAVEQLAERKRVPEMQFALESQSLLFRGNPRRLPPGPEDVEKLDPARAFAFYKDRFGDVTDFTFVVVGEVDPSKLRPLVETYLASLPARGRREKEKDPGIRRVRGVVKKTWSFGQEPKARVIMMFHGDEKWTRDKDRDMFVLGQVLQNRLRLTLREDLGGVYGAGASGGIVRAPHQERLFTIQFTCDPARVDELIRATEGEIAAVMEQGATAGDLESVKQTFLREREVQLRSNGFWAGWLETSYRFGDDPTIVLDPSPMVARMTTDNVKAAARRFLDGKQVFQAVMLPAAAAKAP